MGDRMQLPPVGENESKVFKNVQKKYKYHVVLDEIMRTNSSNIKNACSIIRSWNKKDSLCKLLAPIHNKKNKSFKLYHNSTDIVNTTWFNNFSSKIKQGKIPIILTWYNATCDRYNSFIRKHMHNVTEVNNYLIGDCVIFNNYYCSPTGDNFYTSDMIRIKNINTEAINLIEWESLIIKPAVSQIDRAFNILLNKLAAINVKINVDTLETEKIYTDINVKNPIANTGGIQQVKTIAVLDIDTYTQLINNVKTRIENFYFRFKNEAKTSILWKNYYNKLVDPFADINFGYSITVYKAQGSTFDTVFIDINDIANTRSADEIIKALYTAVGRASHELCLIV